MRILLILVLASQCLRAGLDTAPLEDWLREQASIRSLTADFIQERTLPALSKPVRTSGRLSFVHPGRMRWELGDPASTIAVSDGETATLIDVEKRRARQIDADSPRARPFTLLGHGAFRSSESFHEVFEPVESRVTKGIYQLTVRPRDRSLRRHLPWLYLDIDPSRNELRALTVLLEDETRIRTVFTAHQRNPRVDPALFKPDLAGFRVR